MTSSTANLWTGQLERLPEHADGLVGEIMADPTWRRDAFGVAVIESYGLVSHAGWLRLASAIDCARKSGATAMMLRISSRAQAIDNAGIAFLALERAASMMPTTVFAESAGVCGAALALASFAQRIVGDSEDTAIGAVNVATVFDAKPQRRLAAVIELILRATVNRRTNQQAKSPFAEVSAGLVRAGKLTRTEAEDAHAAFFRLNQ